MMPRAAKVAFLLLVFMLPFMNPDYKVGGLAVIAVDLVYLLTALLWGMVILTGKMKLKWHRFYWVLILYFAGMLVSLPFSTEPATSLFRLATQVYLLSLPVLGHHLVEDQHELKQVFFVWLAASAVVGGLGVVTVLLFTAGVDPSLYEFALHGFGSLPPGPYTRVDLTFFYPALLCNYLTISLMILLICHRMDWLPKPVFMPLLFAILGSAAFSITPGLGGIVLAIGVWLWLGSQPTGSLLGRAALFASIIGALLFVLSATVTPFVHPTAPFLIEVPGLDQPLAPAVRTLVWIQAVDAFVASPLVGHGIGTTPIEVPFFTPDGDDHLLTDGHNVFLNVAMQTGLIGLITLLVLIWAVFRKVRPFSFISGDRNLIRLGLGPAWLNAFVYQGLTGSYEDARYLWVVLGLILAAGAVEAKRGSDQGEAAEANRSSEAPGGGF